MRRGIAAAALGPMVALVLVGCGSGGEDAVPPAPDALLRAVADRDLDAVRDLLDRGADPNAADESGRTAVTAAAYAGAAAIVRALVDAGADVDRRDEMRANALLSTGETGDVAVLEEVLRAGPDLTLTNRYGGTALIPAADRGHLDVVRRLLDTEIEVDHVNDLGWTALLEAVILGDGGPTHVEIVRLLLEAGADRSIADREGVTPLEHARASGYDEMVALLTSPA